MSALGTLPVEKKENAKKAARQKDGETNDGERPAETEESFEDWERAHPRAVA